MKTRKYHLALSDSCCVESLALDALSLEADLHGAVNSMFGSQVALKIYSQKQRSTWRKIFKWLELNNLRFRFFFISPRKLTKSVKKRLASTISSRWIKDYAFWCGGARCIRFWGHKHQGWKLDCEINIKFLGSVRCWMRVFFSKAMHFAWNSLQFISNAVDEVWQVEQNYFFCQMFIHLTVIWVLNQHKPYDANFMASHPSKRPATQKQMAWRDLWTSPAY